MMTTVFWLQLMEIFYCKQKLVDEEFNLQGLYNLNPQVHFVWILEQLMVSLSRVEKIWILALMATLREAQSLLTAPLLLVSLLLSKLKARSLFFRTQK